LVIIPAAGYGRRVQASITSLPLRSKELLPGPEGEPLINHCLQQAADHGLPVHLITRKEKIDLIEHVEKFCQEKEIPFAIQRIEPSREWPESILMSEKFWLEKNILCLPDTVYGPDSIFAHMLGLLNWGSGAGVTGDAFQEKGQAERGSEISQFQGSVDLIVGGFIPEENSFSQWGFFRRNLESEFSLVEKPQAIFDFDPETRAWGLLAFRRSLGKALFEAQLASTFDHSWKTIKARMLFSELTYFQDVTRQTEKA
jgi:hypothetical protein